MTSALIIVAGFYRFILKPEIFYCNFIYWLKTKLKTFLNWLMNMFCKFDVEMKLLVETTWLTLQRTLLGPLCPHSTEEQQTKYKSWFSCSSYYEKQTHLKEQHVESKQISCNKNFQPFQTSGICFHTFYMWACLIYRFFR